VIEALVHWLVMLVVIVAALAAVEFKDMLAAVLSLAVVSLMVSLDFYLLQAPDVAIAEAGVGAALTTIIYILAISKTRRYD
jgi:uncharacterized MnhB-related membrane protein